MVFAENARAVRLFLAMATQWRMTSLSTLSAARLVQTGLDYGVLEGVARMTGHGQVEPEDFARLQIMEGEALAAFADERRART